MTTTSHDDVAAFAARSEELSAQELVAATVKHFGDRVSLACSFQKEESVLLDLLFAADRKARVFAIDTHYLCRRIRLSTRIDSRSPQSPVTALPARRSVAHTLQRP